jgi:diguanylate cyclase (GGDEF)-like protein
MRTPTSIAMSLFERDDLRLWQQGLKTLSASDTHQTRKAADLSNGYSSNAIFRAQQDFARLPSNLPNRELHERLFAEEANESKEWTILNWKADPVTLSFLEISGNAEELLGFAASQWTSNPNFWLEHVSPDDRSEAAQKKRAVATSGMKARFRYRMVAKNKSLVAVEELCGLEATEGGVAVLSGLLIRCELSLENPQEAENRMVRDIVSEIPGLIWSCDKKLNVTWSLGSDFSLLKVRKDHPRNANLLELFPERDSGRVHVSMHLRAVNGESVSYEVESAGRTHQVTLKPVFDEDVQAQGCIGVALDISERKWSEEQVLHLATTDPLTELANYRRFREALDLELRRAERSGRSFSLLLMDLDGLKRINDTHGHLTGSRALCRVAAALRAGCRSMDIVARYGGDEFAVILPEVGAEPAMSVARRACAIISGDAEQPELSASCGTATYPFDGRSGEELIAAADRRLYAQKHELYQSAPVHTISSR